MNEATTRPAYTQACFIKNLVLLLVLLLVLATPHSVEATDFFVRSGDVTMLLVDVINQANDEAANPGPDTINLEGGTYAFTEPAESVDGANAFFHKKQYHHQWDG